MPLLSTKVGASPAAYTQQMAKRRTQKTEKGLEIPVPSKGDFDSAMKKVAPPAGRRRPDEKDRPPKQSG